MQEQQGNCCNTCCAGKQGDDLVIPALLALLLTNLGYDPLCHIIQEMLGHLVGHFSAESFQIKIFHN